MGVENFHSLFLRRGGTSGASDGVVVHPGRDAMLVGVGHASLSGEGKN